MHIMGYERGIFSITVLKELRTARFLVVFGNDVTDLEILAFEEFSEATECFRRIIRWKFA
jgi:hypothetical protein